jgi:hypothetical protein
MAVTPDTNKTSGRAGTAEAGEADRITELELMVQELSATVEMLTKAQLAGVGMDPAGAARRSLGRTVVQFQANYNRLPQPSTVKDAPNVVEGYAVGALEIVRLRNDELERIRADFPTLIETNVDRFVPFQKRTPYLGKDDAGRPRWESKVELLPVKGLIERAPNVG